MTDNSETPGTLWVLLTFAVALVLRIVPLKPTWALLNPDWVALTLIFWTLANPQRVGVLRAWLFGLIADALTGRLLGQHALAYALMVYLSTQGKASLSVIRRPVQALWILGILLMGQLIILWTEQQPLPAGMEWAYWYPTLTGALVWPILIWGVDHQDARSLP